MMNYENKMDKRNILSEKNRSIILVPSLILFYFIHVKAVHMAVLKLLTDKEDTAPLSSSSIT